MILSPNLHAAMQGLDRRSSSRHPKIACVATADTSIRFLLLRQLLYLKSVGFNVVAICAGGPYKKQIEDHGIPIVSVPMTRRTTPAQDLRSFCALIQAFKTGAYDLVHTHTPKAALLGRVAARVARVPHVVHTDLGLYFENKHPLARRLLIWLERMVKPCSDLMLFEDDQAMALARRERLCLPAQSKWIGGGIALKQFTRSQFAPAEVQLKKAQLGLPPNSTVVGIVARLVREKGYDEFFAAAQALLLVRPQLRFLVVGAPDSEKADALTPEAVRQKYCFTNQVVFAGVQFDMPAIYSVMDVFTLPTHRDSWPRAPMEAAAMQLPVVVSDLAGVAPMVKPGISGCVVPVGNSERLASSLLDLVDHPDRARAMGRSGRRLAEERFDEEKVFERVANAYRALLT